MKWNKFTTCTAKRAQIQSDAEDASVSARETALLDQSMYNTLPSKSSQPFLIQHVPVVVYSIRARKHFVITAL